MFIDVPSLLSLVSPLIIHIGKGVTVVFLVAFFYIDN